MSSVEKEFGKGTATFAEDDPEEVERLSLGISQLDWLTLGGFPLGKITVLHGPESGTKTTTAILACARYLERYPDRLAVYIDTEEKAPKQFVRRLGLDGARFAVASRETAEETIDFIEHSLRQKDLGIMVLDSIAGLIPKVEIEAPAGDQQQGVAARQMNKMIRKIGGAQKGTRLTRGWAPTVILVNQERINIAARFTSPITLPGGEGQKFAATLRLRLRTLPITKKEDEVSETAPLVKVSATVMKNSFGPKGRGCEYLMAMAEFAGLHPGDARDEGFVYLQARRLKLIEPSEEVEQEVFDRGELYQELKAKIAGQVERV